MPLMRHNFMCEMVENYHDTVEHCLDKITFGQVQASLLLQTYYVRIWGGLCRMISRRMNAL